MKTENKFPCDSEANGLPQKTRWGARLPMMLLGSAVVSLSLGSCIDIDEPRGHHRTTTTTVYRPGYTVTSLPYGYRSEVIAGDTYYYHDGYYYRPRSGGYVVVEPPRTSRYYRDYDRYHVRGEVITTLPAGYRTVTRQGTTYYRVGDRYYRRHDNGYVITSFP